MEAAHSRGNALLLVAALAIALPYAAAAVSMRDDMGCPGYHYQYPPSTPTPELQPSDFENLKQYNAYLVIQRFKKTIASDPKHIMKTWCGPHVCDYKGFKCDVPPGTYERTIASVDFNGYDIAAPTLCGFVDQLPDLAIFHANTNSFKGVFPDLSHLKYFYELDISNNEFQGQVPVSNIVNIPQLAFLDLRYNSYKGSIPSELFEIKPQDKSLRFEVLFINNNEFDDSIPENLGSTTVKYLTLANNQLKGPIPRSIEETADTLKEVLFLNNRLSGCLPYEVGKLHKATVFDAGSNDLEGPIPNSFGCLTSVEQLNLARNMLSGEVPDVVCRLGLYDHPWGTGKLLNLSLSDNYFTSLGHSCMWLLHKGVLDVRGNCIPDLPDQRSPEECNAFLYRPMSERTCPKYPEGLQYQMPCSPPPPPKGGYNWGDQGAKGTYLATPAPAPSPSVAYAALQGRQP